jgi:ABC-type transport system involved in multi-copper enzyme maturation permease subunit
MSFLPIVERELRAASRRKGTYYLRLGAALAGMGLSGATVFFMFAARGSSAGQELFILLTGYAFGLCLLSGIILTADSLSQEFREGTLGLLFLANLKGYDVVLGKFAAMALSAFYSLLAILPVTALPLLLGGVTGAQFWKTALALLSALFFSLTSGICVSAFSRSAGHAMANALGLMLLAAAALPGFSVLARNLGWPVLAAGLALPSPFTAFYAAGTFSASGKNANFWPSLLVTVGMGCVLLAAASWILPRRWTESRLFANWFFKEANPPGGAWKARAVPDDNPVHQLIPDEPAIRRLLWTIVVLWAVVVVGTGRQQMWAMSWSYVSKAIGFLLKCLVALQVCRFFVEGRRSGSLELLLSTPLRNSEILRGQSLALKRLFQAPLVVFVLLGFVPAVYQLIAALARGGSQVMITAPAALGFQFVLLAWFTLGLGMDVFAVIWVGRWLALSCRRPALAPAYTILFVLVLPSIGVCGLDILIDALLIAWASSHLQQDFRWTLTRASIGP